MIKLTVFISDSFSDCADSSFVFDYYMSDSASSERYDHECL